MFDTFQGLPLHALVVHATVVLVPLMCLLTVLVAVRPVLRVKYAWWTFGGNVLVVALVFVTEPAAWPSRPPSASGLRTRSSTGTNSSASSSSGSSSRLAVTALIVALLKDRGGTTSTGAMALSTVAAVLVLTWVVRIGHSGAQAIWSGVVRKH
jgi:hypothetical protein